MDYKDDINKPRWHERTPSGLYKSYHQNELNNGRREWIDHYFIYLRTIMVTKMKCKNLKQALALQDESI